MFTLQLYINRTIEGLPFKGLHSFYVLFCSIIAFIWWPTKRDERKWGERKIRKDMLSLLAGGEPGMLQFTVSTPTPRLPGSSHVPSLNDWGWLFLLKHTQHVTITSCSWAKVEAWRDLTLCCSNCCSAVAYIRMYIRFIKWHSLGLF